MTLPWWDIYACPTLRDIFFPYKIPKIFISKFRAGNENEISNIHLLGLVIGMKTMFPTQIWKRWTKECQDIFLKWEFPLMPALIYQKRVKFLKLDGLARLMTHLSPTSYTTLSKEEKKKKNYDNVTCDIGHVKCETYHMTHVVGGGEDKNSLEIAAPQLLQFETDTFFVYIFSNFLSVIYGVNRFSKNQPLDRFFLVVAMCI